MTRRRVAFVNTMIAVIVGLSLLAILFRKELWPFSPYTMYSALVPPGRVEVYRLFGVDNTTGEEFRLANRGHMRPFDAVNLSLLLRKLERKGRPLAVEAVSDCLRRYERLRQAGCLVGPPLRALRLYRLDLDTDAPPTRELLVEAHAEE